MEPATLLETVTVTPTRTEQRLGDVPASVSVLTSEAIEASPALLADDVLRQVPTFSLFRRTSSLVAQPTTQGVSLRGIGPSGQSRTLVLLDGIPFNDPFGGWVYWTRVPLASVDRVEITEGTSSSLYGNIAMGGVINIITSRPTRRTIELKPQYGNHDSPKFDFFASDRWKQGVGGGRRQLLEHRRVPHRGGDRARPDRQQRRRRIQERHRQARVHAVRSHSELLPRRLFLREPDQRQGRRSERHAVDDAERRRPRAPARTTAICRRACSSTSHRAHFNFLAVTNAATTRNVVRLATDQNVPTNGVGGMAQWSKSIGPSNVFSAGFDLRWVDGDSQEAAYVACRADIHLPA